MGAILKSQWLYQFGPQWEIFTNNALFILVSLKDFSFYGKPKKLNDVCENPLWLKKFTLMFKKCGNNFTNGGRKMRMATTVCEYCFCFFVKIHPGWKQWRNLMVFSRNFFLI